MVIFLRREGEREKEKNDLIAKYIIRHTFRGLSELYGKQLHKFGSIFNFQLFKVKK